MEKVCINYIGARRAGETDQQNVIMHKAYDMSQRIGASFFCLNINPLIQEGGGRGGGCCSLPFGFSLVPFLRFCQDSYSVNLPTLCQDTHVSMKTFFKNCYREKSRGGEVEKIPRREREGPRGGIKNK